MLLFPSLIILLDFVMKGVILFGCGFSYFFYTLLFISCRIFGWRVSWLFCFLEQVHYDPFLSSSYFFPFQFHFFSILFFLFCSDMSSTNCHVGMKIIHERTRL